MYAAVSSFELEHRTENVTWVLLFYLDENQENFFKPTRQPYIYFFPIQHS
jgi:hypothetical protein